MQPLKNKSGIHNLLKRGENTLLESNEQHLGVLDFIFFFNLVGGIENFALYTYNHVKSVF